MNSVYTLDIPLIYYKIGSFGKAHLQTKKMRLAIKMMLGVILLMKLMIEGIHAKAFLVETADNDDREMTGNTDSLVQQVYVHMCTVGFLKDVKTLL